MPYLEIALVIVVFAWIVDRGLSWLTRREWHRLNRAFPTQEIRGPVHWDGPTLTVDLLKSVVAGHPVEVLPSIPGHAHVVGKHGQLTCGCQWPWAKAKR